MTDVPTSSRAEFAAELNVEKIGSVHKIRLQLLVPYHFEAGQYLCVQHPDGTDIPLSIASAPEALPLLELRFQATAEDPLSLRMLDLLEGERLNLSSAQGTVTSRPYDEPLFVVAGGSGIAQAISCAADRHHTKAAAATKILWCVDKKEDIPDSTLFDAYPNTEMTLKVDARRDSANSGLAWIRANTEQIVNARVILTGSPAFVYLIHDLLLELGLDARQLHSDVYAYAPR